MFENVIGHQNVKKELQEQLKMETVTHSYIFYGTKGIGKKLLAEEFAKQILEVDKIQTCPDYKYINRLPRED